MSNSNTPRLAFSFFAYMVLSASVVGFFVGMQSPMRITTSDKSTSESQVPLDDDGVLPATSYSDLGTVLRTNRPEPLPVAFTSPAKQQQTQQVSTLKSENSTLDKTRALGLREQTRAFNGAPPTIPHPIEQMSAESCMACHQSGIKTQTLRAPTMSHQYFSNCTQCHIEQNSQISKVAFADNSFEGLKAPTEGPRAFAAAPPQVPHSTWMRENCLSCHGFTGRKGVQTTHPWRTNCTQCHTASAEFEQILFPSKPKFLVPPKIAP